MAFRIVILLLLLSQGLAAQQKYWVFFKDKKCEGFDPHAFFDEKAIERRIKNQVDLYDHSDLPVNIDYIKAVDSYGDSLSAISRWFNAVVIYSDDTRISMVKELGFVDSVSNCGLLVSALSIADDDKKLDRSSLDLLDHQTRVLGREDLKKKGVTGRGVRIAVLDAGFSDADENRSFDHLRANRQIIKTYDFIKKREHVYDHSDHGTMVLSCIAGIYDSLQIGLATASEFLLARTEHNFREPYSEEEHWVEAAEWADRNGADIINSSLGYTQERYFQSDLDGRTSMVSRAATIAARKGILVVNAAGNEGSDKWKKLGVPADADSILTVGGTDPYKAYHVSFSSYGPTADKRMKPNVSAPGIVQAAVKKKIGRTEGTSFSSPLIAGFAACILEMNKEMSCQQLLHAIERSGRLYPYYDYAHGFGIPRAAYFTGDSISVAKNLFAEFSDGLLRVKVDSAALSGDASDLLYYHVREASGYIHNYYVVRVNSSEQMEFDIADPAGKIIALHFKGYTTEIETR